MLYLVLGILLVGFVVTGLILMSSRKKVDGVPRDLLRAGQEEPASQGGALRRAWGRTAWMMRDTG